MHLFQKPLFILFLLFYLGRINESVHAQTTSRVKRCLTVVARILSPGDQHHAQGSLLCPSDQVRPMQGKQPLIVCHNSNSLLKGKEGQVDRLCSAGRQKLQPHKSRLKYLKSRGSTEKADKLRLIQPFGTMIIQRRPDLAWTPVKGSTHYLVSIEGPSSKSEQLVHDQNRLSYPPNWPSLEHGTAYYVTVFAYQTEKIISSDRSKLNLLYKEEASLVQEAVAAINQLSLSPVEAAKELDAVYMSHKLLHDSIGVLQRLADSGQSNYQLNRLLTDRYFQVGQPELAPKTEEAQLPTRMKLPQK